MTFSLKKNDTSPAMLATLQGANGVAINLTGASVRFYMRPVGGGQATVNEAAVIMAAESGLVRYDWVNGSTGTVGSFQSEFELTYPDGAVETFPNNGYIRVEIIDDIA